MDIQEIIILAKGKNADAERKLFNALAPKLMRLCKRYSNDDHQAKDYLQECFIKIFDNIKKYDNAKGRFEPWAYRVSTNLILEKKRKIKVRFEEIKFDYEEEIQESDFERISDEELLMAIRKLPSGYRDILNLFVFEKLPHKDIGQLLGIKESTSRSQFTRAKKMLKKILIQTIPNIHERQLV